MNVSDKNRDEKAEFSEISSYTENETEPSEESKHIKDLQGQIRDLQKQNGVLQEQLEQTIDKDNERFFFCIIGFVIFFDVLFFPTLPPSWGYPIAFLVLEVFLLVPLARRFGVEDVPMLATNIVDILKGQGARGKEVEQNDNQKRKKAPSKPVKK